MCRAIAVKYTKAEGTSISSQSQFIRFQPYFIEPMFTRAWIIESTPSAPSNSKTLGFSFYSRWLRIPVRATQIKIGSDARAHALAMSVCTNAAATSCTHGNWDFGFHARAWACTRECMYAPVFSFNDYLPSTLVSLRALTTDGYCDPSACLNGMSFSWKFEYPNLHTINVRAREDVRSYLWSFSPIFFYGSKDEYHKLFENSKHFILVSRLEINVRR